MSGTLPGFRAGGGRAAIGIFAQDQWVTGEVVGCGSLALVCAWAEGSGLVTRVAVLGQGWIGSAVRRSLDPGVVVDVDGRSALNSADEGTGVAALRQALRPDPDLVVVNAIGRMRAAPDQLWHANAEVPRLLVAALEGTSARLVHLGSAAEYGDVGDVHLIPEDQPPNPVSEYGRSKLAGTQAALTHPDSCVLRPFNVVGPGMAEGSPAVEFGDKVRTALAGDGLVHLRSADTTRDFLSLGFLVAVVVWAIGSHDRGIYNVCSGTGIDYPTLVHALAQVMGGSVTVVDGREGGLARAVGDPSLLREHAGLAESLDAAAVASLVVGRAD